MSTVKPNGIKEEEQYIKDEDLLREVGIGCLNRINEMVLSENRDFDDILSENNIAKSKHGQSYTLTKSIKSEFSVIEALKYGDGSNQCNKNLERVFQLAAEMNNAKVLRVILFPTTKYTINTCQLS